MINTFRIYEELAATLGEEGAKKLTSVLGRMYDDLQQTVTRTEFADLREIVRDLAEAQKITGQRVQELSEAQKRTELRVEELAEAQKRTEQKVRELCEAQQRTEQKVQELCEAQQRTELRVEELAGAMVQTRRELSDLSRQVGGLSMAVGHGIEDRIIVHMADFARRTYGLEVFRVRRRNLVYPDGSFDEINIFVEGNRGGEPVILIGECKAHPGKKDFDRFDGLIRRAGRELGGTIEAFMAGYTFSPEIEAYADARYPGVRRFKTYEFELPQG